MTTKTDKTFSYYDAYMEELQYEGHIDEPPDNLLPDDLMDHFWWEICFHDLDDMLCYCKTRDEADSLTREMESLHFTMQYIPMQ